MNLKGRSIALFIPTLNGGGAERVIVTLANGFATLGFSVDLVLANAEGPYLKHVKSSVRIIDLKATRVIKALFPLMRYLQRERPLAMLTALTYANILAILARKLAGVKTRLVISERSTISVRVKQAQGFIARLIYASVPRLYASADAIVAVSKAAAEDLVYYAELPSSAVEYIYNPFDIDLIQSFAEEEVYHPWFEYGQPPVILAIGRLDEAKDYSSLLNSFVLLRKAISARLLILGEGKLRADLERKVAELGLTNDDVQMPGFVNNPFSYLSKCRVFVLSSRYEGLPGALIEAMACGAPVVSTDCRSGPREILEGGHWGRLVPVGDVQALANAIIQVLESAPEQLPDVRRRAQDFAQEKAVKAYLRVLGVQSK